MKRSLTVTEARLFLREPAAVFWGVVFPVVLLVIIGSIPSSREASADLGGERFIDVYVPVLIAFVLAMLALNALPPTVAGYRERGVLRRLATTPVGPAPVLGAQLAVSLGVAVCSWVLILAVGRAAFGVALPRQAVGFLVAVVLVAAALLAVGMLVAAVAPSARTANAVGAILFFPMMFLAGLWLPRDVMPDALRTMSDLTPLGAGVGALQSAMEGDWPRGLHFAVLAVWAVGCGGAAVRLFRWQ
jgi:ABC-2 type transport system permease protein